ncbi:hypothetical protein I4U23_011321 [Adineta vaga]|nr:hypothetical protein I4U23_011321 [Adineta vaga]
MNTTKPSCVLYEKKWGVYTDDPWEVFVMDRKGQAVFPFSRRPVPVNLFQALRAKMAAQTAKEKDDLHIDEKEYVCIAAEPWSIATTFEEIDLGHNVSTNSTIPHFLPDRYDKDDDEEESWDSNDLSDYIRYEYDYYGYLREIEEEYGQYDDYLDESFWAGLPDPFESYDWEC